MAVPAAEIDVRLLGAPEAAGHAGELEDLHAEVYADSPYRQDAGQAAGFADRFRVQRRQPGFTLAEARSGGYLVGYAYGLPLRPATSWWRYLTTPLPGEATAERPGRTFALADLLVRAAWRRQGIAGDLHQAILRGRPEERAVAAVLPAAVPAQAAGQQWGWRKLARSREPGAPLLDVLVLTLPPGRG
jgi:GNAT superfamily N-acetyltransferase